MPHLLRHRVSVGGQDIVIVLGLAIEVDGLGFEHRWGGGNF